MAGIMLGLVELLVVVGGILARRFKASEEPKGESAPAAEPSASTADELRRLREAESEVERTCRETQDAIITRAMWRALRPHGGGQSE